MTNVKVRSAVAPSLFQSMVTAADVDLGFTGGGYSTNGFIDSTVSVGTVVSPGLQNRYDNVMDELSEKQGRVSRKSSYEDPN